ncbi:ABC transporter substrate-binding protein [Desertimonas flava]|uniref:ABC transporter substrate-binding protein n=1 Tax=Desertimonas flava TaxID=2064846 RepID=UPI0013C4CE0E|nr:ABC transporter substrate-binding protein [Desertimonas flava]
MTHRMLQAGRPRRSLRRGLIAALAVAVASAGGAVSATSVETAPPSEPAEPTTGGSAKMVMLGSLVAMDPSLHRVSLAYAEGAIMGAVFGHLAYFNPQTGEVELYFLESLEPNEASTVWTLTLHDGIKFSDGTPMNAEAIKFNIERSADPETGSRFQAVAAPLELEVLDELTLQVTLPAPNPGWAGDLVANFAGIGSPTAIQAAIDEGVEVGTRPVGAGPFMVKDWDPGQTITLERNPYFAEFHPGRPYLDELTFENVTDRSQQVSAVASGAAQMTSTIGGGPTAELLESANAIASHMGGGATLNLNTARPPFDDVRARQALYYALDRSLLAEASTPNTPVVTNLFPASSPFYDAAYDLPAQNPEEAQRLFDELAAEGKPLEWTLTVTPSPSETALVDTIIAQLAEYENVSFEALFLQPTEQIAASTSGEYQALSWAMQVVSPIPSVYQAVHPEGYLNPGKWSNDTVAGALENLQSATTVEEQKAVWDVVQEQIIADVPVIFTGQQINTVGFSDDFIVPRTINIGAFPLWEEVGYR